MASKAELESALRSARRLLDDEYAGVLDMYCPRDSDGEPILSEIDAAAVNLERRYRRIFKLIDRVLA